MRAVREGGGPSFLELSTYRFRAHSMYDSDRYRDKAEIAQWKQRDPITLLMARLRADGELSDAALTELEAALTGELDAAVAAAEEGPYEPVEDLTRFIYSEVPS